MTALPPSSTPSSAFTSGSALRALPLHEARWITVGPGSPAGSLAALVSAARELAGGGPKKVA